VLGAPDVREKLVFGDVELGFAAPDDATADLCDGGLRFGTPFEAADKFSVRWRRIPHAASRAPHPTADFCGTHLRHARSRGQVWYDLRGRG
jgi:hypothetical protein